MNFKEIIKEEWEKEYQTSLEQEPYNIEDSIFSIYHELVERICVRVWNQAIEKAAHDISDKPIIRLKINKQRTNETEL